MAYDEVLAGRVRKILARSKGVSERKMFGGLSFMLSGHMCCGIVGEELMVRVGPEGHEEALARPHARPMDFTGRAMKGLVYVSESGFKAERDLAAWVQRGVDFAGSLPPKTSRR